MGLCVCVRAICSHMKLTFVNFGVKGVPASKMSVKGCGKTFPDPAGAETLDGGVVVPCGKSFDNSMNTKSSLLYNEVCCNHTTHHIFV